MKSKQPFTLYVEVSLWLHLISSPGGAGLHRRRETVRPWHKWLEEGPKSRKRAVKAESGMGSLGRDRTMVTLRIHGRRQSRMQRQEIHPHDVPRSDSDFLWGVTQTSPWRPLPFWTWYPFKSLLPLVLGSLKVCMPFRFKFYCLPICCNFVTLFPLTCSNLMTPCLTVPSTNPWWPAHGPILISWSGSKYPATESEIQSSPS